MFCSTAGRGTPQQEKHSSSTMGRPYLQYFDQTPDNKFCICCACEAHIASSQEYRRQFNVNELLVGLFQASDLTVGLFRTAINVHTLSPEQDRKVGACTVSDVYCNRCGNVLGIKFIEVANDDAAVRDGYVLLRGDKLKKWNGHEIV